MWASVLHYLRVGGCGSCLGVEKLRARILLENAQTPTRQVHIVLGGNFVEFVSKTYC